MEDLVEKLFEENKESLKKYVVLLENKGCSEEYINNQKMVTATYLYMTRALFIDNCKQNSTDGPTPGDNPSSFNVVLPVEQTSSGSSSEQDTSSDDTTKTSTDGDSDSEIDNDVTDDVCVCDPEDCKCNSTIPPYVTCEGDDFSKKLNEIREEVLKRVDAEWNPRRELVKQKKRAIVEAICSSKDIIHFNEENVKNTSIWVLVLQGLDLKKREVDDLKPYFSGLFRRKGFFRDVVLCMTELHKDLCEDCTKTSD